MYVHTSGSRGRGAVGKEALPERAGVGVGSCACLEPQPQPSPPAVPSGSQMWPSPRPSCFLEMSKAGRGQRGFCNGRDDMSFV